MTMLWQSEVNVLPCIDERSCSSAVNSDAPQVRRMSTQHQNHVAGIDRWQDGVTSSEMPSTMTNESSQFGGDSQSVTSPGCTLSSPSITSPDRTLSSPKSQRSAQQSCRRLGQ